MINVQRATIELWIQRGPSVRKLFTGLIMYLPSQNKEHCIVLYCIVLDTLRRLLSKKEATLASRILSKPPKCIHNLWMQSCDYYNFFCPVIKRETFPRNLP